MKKKSTFYIFLLFAMIGALTSCHNNEQAKPALSKEDSMKIVNWDKLFSGKPSASKQKSFSRPLNYAYGAACVARFEEYMKKLSSTDLQNFKDNVYTDYVKYSKDGLDGSGRPASSSDNLFYWIGTKINANPKYSHFAVCFGMYVDPKSYTNPNTTHDPAYLDQDIANYINGNGDIKKNLVNRITVFIRPYPFPTYDKAALAGGDDDDYFNLGEINPPKP